jgi:hypothetical protein
MKTMRAWRDHKALDTPLFARVSGLHVRMHAFQALASELSREDGCPAFPFDFRAAFARDLRQTVEAGLNVREEETANYHLDHRYGTGPYPAVPKTGSHQCSCDVGAGTGDPDAMAAWLENAGVTQFRIEGNTVHVDGDVDISGRKLETIPVKFGRVNGHFDCSENRLTSLCQLPDTVIGNVYCCNNPVCSLAGLDSDRTIAGYLCLDGDQVVADALGAVLVNGLQRLVTSSAELGIVNSYLGRPHDVFECQSEFIDRGGEELATLGTCCDCGTGAVAENKTGGRADP